MRFTVYNNLTAEVAAAIANKTNKAAHSLAQQIKSDTSPYVPMSGNAAGLDNRTRVVGNTIIYPGPYARYLYHGKKMVEEDTGRGPMRIIDNLGNEYIRYHKGAKLRPTDVPLNYNTTYHPKAGAHWLERSKADNLEKWKRLAAKELING